MAIGVRKVPELSHVAFRGQGNEETLAKMTEKGAASEEGQAKQNPKGELETE